MKMNSLKAAAIIGLSALAAGTAAAQDGAASKPVGYETLNYQNGFNFLGLRLVGAPQGTAAVVSATGSDVTLDASLGDGSYIFEVVGGTGAGIVTTATVAGAVATTADDLSTGIDDTSQVQLRAHQTLENVFGTAAEPEIEPGASKEGADQVWVPRGDGGFSKYYIQGVFGSNEWREILDDNSENAIDATQVNLIYPDGVILRGAGAGALVVTGNVKITPTIQAVSPGFNFLSSVYPAGSTLESLFGAAADADLTGGAVAPGSDQVWVPSDDPSGFDKYYIGESFGAREWRDIGNNAIDATGVDITPGVIFLSAGANASNVATTAPSFYANL